MRARKNRVSRRIAPSGALASPPSRRARWRANVATPSVIQKHAARRSALRSSSRARRRDEKLGGDARRPSLVPGEKRLASARLRITRSPTTNSKARFRRVNMSGGTVMIWDRGHWQPESDPHKGLARGPLSHSPLRARSCSGGWHLVRMHRTGGRENATTGFSSNSMMSAGNAPPAIRTSWERSLSQP